MRYKEHYIINKDGSIYSLKSNRIMKPFTLGQNYLGVSINRKPEYVHRIVANVFLPNEDNKSDVNHIDGNKHNNSVSNLEWCSHKENIKHSFDKLGRIHHLSKLNKQQVSKIRKSKLKGTELAKIYKVSTCVISLVKNNKIWN